jgi:cupin 2 domain-containing protein
MKSANIHDSIPIDLCTEAYDNIIRAPGVRIERIVSKGHTSPESGWYDQEENEWVMVLQGSGTLTFEDGSTAHLSKGDHLKIPAHCKHRVSWTNPNQLTIWLAVFYR